MPCGSVALSSGQILPPERQRPQGFQRRGGRHPHCHPRPRRAEAPPIPHHPHVALRLFLRKPGGSCSAGVWAGGFLPIEAPRREASVCLSPWRALEKHHTSGIRAQLAYFSLTGAGLGLRPRAAAWAEEGAALPPPAPEQSHLRQPALGPPAPGTGAARQLSGSRLLTSDYRQAHE